MSIVSTSDQDSLTGIGIRDEVHDLLAPSEDTHRVAIGDGLSEDGKVWANTFESPTYFTGNAFSCANPSASTLPTSGTAPSAITSLTSGVGCTWTATVQAAGNSGNRLLFLQGSMQPFLGQLEAVAQQGAAGQSGTWFAQMTYTRLTTQGGPLLSMRLLNDWGITMLGHPNHITLYADSWEGQTLRVGVPYQLRVEIDMGTPIVRTYLNGVLLNTYSTATGNSAGRSFAGLQLDFYGTMYNPGPVFSLDNIRVGSVAAEDTHPSATIPDNVYRLPVSQRSQLQTLLDLHKVVALEPGDYCTGGPASITLSSDYKLYGSQCGTTAIPPVTVAAGSQGVVLARVKVAVPTSNGLGTGTLTFPSSSQVTKGNVFAELEGAISVNGATLSDNLFLHLQMQINADTRTGGYLRNNRFLRTKVHAAWPALTLLGDSAQQSYGNVFLWYNFLTPGGDATNIDNQRDLTFAAVDSESWNWNGVGSNSLFRIGAMGTLRCFGMNGGVHLPASNIRGQYDIGATEFQLFNDVMAPTPTNPGNHRDLVYRSTNQRSLLISSRHTKVVTDQTSAPFRVNAWEGTNLNFLVNGTAYTSALPSGSQSTLYGMIAPTSRTGSPWEPPSYGPVPDPAGPNWSANRASGSDSTAYLQGLIDTNGVAKLPPGIFYITAPLKLKHGQGIIGAGADSTVIVAKTSSMDMLVADDAVTTQTGTNIRITDLTLQGGRNGVHLEPVGAKALEGRKAQYNLCTISHVTFRNMAEAGMSFDQIYAVDNNFWSYLNFVSCQSAIKQTVDPSYSSGETPTMMYIDKVTFYRCQFLNNGLALNLPGARGSNLNSWINCLFANNTAGVGSLNNWPSALFANCDFVNNGPLAGKNHTIANNLGAAFLNCRFKSGANGSAAIFGGPIAAEGCTFERAGSTNSTILAGSNGSAFFYNSHSTDVPLNVTSTIGGLLMNNTFGASGNSAYSQRVVALSGGAIHTLVPGTSAPVPQILFGSDWSAMPAAFRNY